MKRGFSSIALATLLAGGAASLAGISACSGTMADTPQDAGASIDASASTDAGASTDASAVDGATTNSDSGFDAGSNADATPTSPTDASPDALPDGSPDAPIDGGMAPDVGAPACTTAQRTQRAAHAIAQPLVPLASAGGVNLFTAPMQPLTLLDAETALCPGDDLGDLFGNGSRVMSWGENTELWLDYNLQTTKGRFFVAYSGYLGAMTFHSPESTHTYVAQIFQQLTKDGQLFALDWHGAGFGATMDELYRAMLATYAPGTPQPAVGTLCATTNECRMGSFGDVGYIFFKSLGAAIWVQNINAAQPAASIPFRIDINLVP